MSSTPPLGDEDGSTTSQAGDRLSLAMSDIELAASASSLSLSASLPEDFDIKHYETDENVEKVTKIQSFIRKVSVLQHYNLICT